MFSVFLVPEHKDEQHFYKLSSTCRVTLIKIWSDRSSGDGKDIAAYFFLLIYLRLSGVLARCLDFRQFKPGYFFGSLLKKPPIILENIFATNKKYHGKCTGAENLTSLAAIFDHYCQFYFLKGDWTLMGY